jgi:hypothetical protein
VAAELGVRNATGDSSRLLLRHSGKMRVRSLIEEPFTGERAADRGRRHPTRIRMERSNRLPLGHGDRGLSDRRRRERRRRGLSISDTRS